MNLRLRWLITMIHDLHFHATDCTLNRKSFVVELMYFIRALIKNHFSTLKKRQKVQNRATTSFFESTMYFYRYKLCCRWVKWTSDKLLIWLRVLAMEVESRYSKSTTQDPLKGFPGNTIMTNVSYRQSSCTCTVKLIIETSL